MLPRSLNNLFDNIRDFYVIELDGKVRGCAALHIVWPVAEPVLSDRDRRLGTLADYLSGTPFVYGG